MSEDDFDAETRDEAAHYAAVQANELAREQQREENKRLKEQGRPVKALPRKIQERRPQNAVDDEESEEDDDGGDGYDERYYTSTGEKMKKKPKTRYSQREHELHNQGREDTLRYEGRESRLELHRR